ncbi:MAG: TetR/AcrR family transcriptional regulator [Myxococcales bacterium]|nr:TetR/AcrR family transcriptional regulator [Myxococcales bacterium]
MADTQDALRSAARDLFVEAGLAGFSMRKVAARVGVTATSIYRHFEDKDALLAAVVDHGFRGFAGYLMRSLEGQDPLERLSLCTAAYIDFALDNPRDYALMFMTNCADLGLERTDEDSRERRRGTFQMLVDRIDECMDAGLLSEAPRVETALGVWSHAHGLASLWLSGHLGDSMDEAGFRELARDALAATYRGLMAEPVPGQNDNTVNMAPTTGGNDDARAD